MRSHRLSVVVPVLVVIALLVVSVSSLPAAPIQASFKETKDLIDLVADASTLVEKDGETAFAEFRREGSRWYHKDTYIFVVDLKGVVHVNPSRPELEGKNNMNLKDLVGRPFIKAFVDEVTSYGNKKDGWTHYVWFKPGDEVATWKTSYLKYVKAPSGKDYIVGSGLYDMKMERIFVVNMVEKAAILLKLQGKAAFQKLRDPLGQFNYLTSYIFVIDGTGKDLVNPAFPGFEGQNVMNLKDSNGKHFIKEMVQSLTARDSMWLNYSWPKPRHANPSQKSTYVRKLTVGNNVYYIGSGVYLE